MYKPIGFILFFFISAATYAADSLSCKGSNDAAGLKHGVWLCRLSNGRVQKKEHYKHGTLVSYTIFDERGRTVETMNKKGKIRKYTPCGC